MFPANGPPDVIIEVVQGPLLPAKSSFPEFIGKQRNTNIRTTATLKGSNISANLLDIYEGNRYEWAFESGVINVTLTGNVNVSIYCTSISGSRCIWVHSIKPKPNRPKHI